MYLHTLHYIVLTGLMNGAFTQTRGFTAYLAIRLVFAQHDIITNCVLGAVQYHDLCKLISA
jgi:hypothetical protein